VYTYGVQRVSQDQVISNTWTPSFYGYDGGGTVRALTNAAGAVTDAYDYDGFGNEINSTGSTPNSYLYRGEYFDSDLGLYYLRARYYNSLTGRFLSRDPNEPKVRGANGTPIDPKKLHKYLYAGGDPVNRIDPSGRDDYGEYGMETDIDEVIADRARRGIRKAELEAFCFAMANLFWLQNPDYGLENLWVWEEWCLERIPTY
jgi:RHS repeat-associated protein